MGMDLFNEGEGYFRWNTFFWFYVVQLAQLYGWKPAGTLKSLCEDDPWCKETDKLDETWWGKYDSNDCQVVTADDARSWAEALEKALPDISDEQSGKADLSFSNWLHLQAIIQAGLLSSKKAKQELLDRFSGETKSCLQEFITFCRQGSFMIG